MLGVFYAYTGKHNDCFLKTNLYNMYKIKLHETSKCLAGIYSYVCCEMNVFFDFFLNHLPKTHRSVLRKITIDLFIFEMFMTSIYEKKILTEVLLIHAEQMSLCTSF